MANLRSKKLKTHLAVAFCEDCRDVFTSGGGFRYCECRKSFIDQERFSALFVRTGGNCTFIEQICPSDCKLKEHRSASKK